MAAKTLRAIRNFFPHPHLGLFPLALLIIASLFMVYGLSGGGSVDEKTNHWLFGHQFDGLNTLFTGLAFAGLIYTILLQKTSFDETIRDLEESSAREHYGELDRLYFELLKIAVDKPYLRDPKYIRHNVVNTDYTTYAYMTWNFIEAVHDRLGPRPPERASTTRRPGSVPESPDPEKTVQERQREEPDANGSGAEVDRDASIRKQNELRRLWATWGKAVDHESALHAAWWQRHENRCLFKPELAEVQRGSRPDYSSPASQQHRIDPAAADRQTSAT